MMGFPPGVDQHASLRQNAAGLPLAPWKESSLDGGWPGKVSVPAGGPLAASEIAAGRQEEEEAGWRVAHDRLFWLPSPFRRNIMG